MTIIVKKVDPVIISNCIEALRAFVTDSGIDPLVSILESLKEDPENKDLITQLADSLNSIGILKGAVLSYAPYISSIISEDLFPDD